MRRCFHAHRPLALLGLAPAASLAQTAAPNRLTAEEARAGWRLLFDGRTTKGWRGYHLEVAPAGWRVAGGALTRTGPAGDLITREQFANFELVLEWNVAPGGNSGIFYRGTEEYEVIYRSAPEMQVLDDERHADGTSRLTAAGACYGLYPAHAGVGKSAGQWNQARIVVNRNQVEHWLNGVKVVEGRRRADTSASRITATGSPSGASRSGISSRRVLHA